MRGWEGMSKRGERVAVRVEAQAVTERSSSDDLALGHTLYLSSCLRLPDWPSNQRRMVKLSPVKRTKSNRKLSHSSLNWAMDALTGNSICQGGWNRPGGAVPMFICVMVR